MVLLTFVCAAVLASVAATGEACPEFGTLLAGTIGMLFIACSGNAMNMYVERYSPIF